jgi:hypothetical protein
VIVIAVNLLKKFHLNKKKFPPMDQANLLLENQIGWMILMNKNYKMNNRFNYKIGSKI